MKKKINLLKFTLACIMGGTIFFACSKEDSRSDKNLQSGSPVQQQDLNVEQKILAFKQKCKFFKENPQVKTGGLINVDEAVWNMEASLNYTYSFSSINSGDQHVKSAELPLTQLSGDSIDYAVVAATYYRLIDSLAGFYNSVNVANKKVLLMDLGKIPATSKGPAKLKLTCVIGPSDAAPAPPPTDPFGPADYWFYGFNGGKCGPYYNTVLTSDAAKEIEKYQGAYKLPNIPNYHLYFTDVETKDVIGDAFLNTNDVTPNDNMYDYLMFNNKSNLPNFHDCLSPDEMNFYYNWTYFVLTDPGKVRAFTTPPLKTFISVNLSGVNVAYPGQDIVSHFA